jgi:hypothetical protein
MDIDGNMPLLSAANDKPQAVIALLMLPESVVVVESDKTGRMPPSRATVIELLAIIVSR